jgi:hypothetical protein
MFKNKSTSFIFFFKIEDHKNILLQNIPGSQGGGYYDNSLLGCNVVWFRRDLLLPTSGYNKQRRQ